MGRFVPHSLWKRKPSTPKEGDLDASSTMERAAPLENEPKDQSARVKRLAALKKELGPLTSDDYARLTDQKRDQLRKYELDVLQGERDDLMSNRKKLSEAKRQKVANYDDCIQSHTDEGGDAYYIGDAYEPINPVYAAEWEVKEPQPYLTYIKKLARTWPHLEYLAHWMEVGCAPTKWKQLREEKNRDRRDERIKLTKACFIDYIDGKSKPPQTFEDCTKLRNALLRDAPANEVRQARLIIVEDLSRDVVETLGALYDVDPLFFLSHVMDYLFHNTRDRWVELPNLDIDARRMSHFTLGYLRARYFENGVAFDEAEEQIGRFNVLRRLDSDRSRQRFMNGLLDLPGASVALSRAKTSLWIQPRPDAESKLAAEEPITAIMLVDPTVTADRSHPLWGGYRPFEATPSMKQLANLEKADAPEGKTLFEHAIYWSSRLSSEDIDHIKKEPRCIGIPMFKIVIADWLTVLKYMTTMLGKIEWEFEKPHWGETPKDIDRLLKKLSPWRRNVGYYETMISEAIARLFPPEVRAPLHASSGNDHMSMPMFMRPHADSERGVFSLWTDFQNVKRQIDEIQARIQSIEDTATNAINIEESRRAVEENRRSVKQNKNLARLTFLATIFIPLNFTSSFLSISPDFSSATTSIWLFFAIGIPLTLFALLVVDLSHPGGKGVVRTFFQSFSKKKNVPPTETADITLTETQSRAQTNPWGHDLRQKMTMKFGKTG